MRQLLLVGVLGLAACAGTNGGMGGGGYAPVIDTAGSSAARQGRDYGTDLAECQALANQRSTVESAAVTGAGSAAVGAAGGAILGALGPGSAGRNAALGGALGALGGTTAGAVSGEQERKRIVSNCMSGRGWNVLAQ